MVALAYSLYCVVLSRLVRHDLFMASTVFQAFSFVQINFVPSGCARTDSLDVLGTQPNDGGATLSLYEIKTRQAQS